MATTSRGGQAQYVEFDEFVDSKLVRTRMAIRSTDIMVAIVASSAVVLSYLLLFVVADHWLGMDFLPSIARSAIGLSIVIGAIAWAAWRIGLPHRRQINRLFVAREIETHESALEGNLLNLVDLQQAERSIDRPVMRSIEKRAAVGLSQTDVDGTVDRRPLMRSAYTLLGLVVTACLYTLLTFSLGLKPIGPSLLRAFGATATSPTRIQFESVEIQIADGDTFVTADTSPQVPARFQPRIRATLNKALEEHEHVTLFYTTADQRFVDEPLEMRPVDGSQLRIFPEYLLTLIGENDRGLLQDLSFRLEAGDAVTDTYTIHVSTAPSATVDTVDHKFPAYMQLAAESRDGGNIDSWEGTSVTVHATASRPVRSARLVFSDSEDTSQRAEEYPMRVTDGTQLTVQWTLSFRRGDQEDYPRFYRIVCQDEQGATDLNPTLHPIAIRPDLPPQVELLDPRSDLELPANAVVPLLIKAHDPDFQLTHLTLRVEQDGQQLVEHNRELFSGEQPVFGPASIDFPLEPLGLQPGQTISYWIEARDNKMPLGNRTNTAPKLNIRITEPVTPEEAKKQRDQQRQKQQDAIQQEQEKQQQQNDDTSQDSPPPSGDSTNPADKSDDKPGENNDKPGQDGKPQAGDTPSEADAVNKGDKGTDPKTDSTKSDSNEKPSSDKKGGGAEPKPGSSEQDPSGQQPDSKTDGATKPGSGTPDPDAKPKPLNTDGTDDDEALKRIRDFQNKRDGKTTDGTPDASDPTDDQGSSPKSDPSKPQQSRKPSDSNDPNSRKDKSGAKKSGGSAQKPDMPSAEGKQDGKADPRKGGSRPDSKSTKPKNSAPPKDNKTAPKGGKKSATEPDGSKSEPKNGSGQQPPKKGKGQSGGSKTKKGAAGKKGEGESKSGGKDKPDAPPGDQSESSGNKSGTGKKGAASKSGDPKNSQPTAKKGNSPSSKKDKDGKNQKTSGKDANKGGDKGKKSGKGKQEESQGAAKKSGSKPGNKPSNKPGSKGGKGSSGKKAVEGTGGNGAQPGSARQDNEPGNGEKDGNGKPSGLPEGDPANEEFSKEAANLVLKRIEDELQRGKVDPDLLKSLGWDADDVKKFTNRLRDQANTPAADTSPEAQAKRRQFEDLLKSINIKSNSSKRTGRSKRQRKTDSLNAQDIPVPLQFREAVKLYRRNLSRRSTRGPAKPPQKAGAKN